ncbi:MAG: hypothetical protein QOG10_633 [Kribbellaceae bacterium]|jgi:hypothetical protein|nr:hypothetical protein [Kribbellaceae bacterium]
MGDEKDEAKATHAIQQAGVNARAEWLRREAERQRQVEAEKKEAEDLRKQVEEAVKRKQAEEAAKNKMVVDEPGRPTGEAWPEKSAEPSSPGLMSTMAAKLGVGKPGDVELVKKLLDAGRPPASGQTGSGTQADGAKARTFGAVGGRGPAAAAER